jgi:hypothetical protein
MPVEPQTNLPFSLKLDLTHTKLPPAAGIVNPNMLFPQKCIIQSCLNFDEAKVYYRPNIASNCYLLVLDCVLDDDRSICGFMAEKTVSNLQPPEKHLVGNQEHMQCLGINVGGHNNF